MPLAKKIGQGCLPTIRPFYWSPKDEGGCLKAEWKFAEGITDSGPLDFKVSQWDDQSGNDNHLIQGTLLNQPENGNSTATKGTITFRSADEDHFTTSSQISLADDFTIGMMIYVEALPVSGGYTILADVTTANEWMKITATNNLRLKIDGNLVNLSLDGINSFTDGKWNSIMLTRDSSDLITLYFNGVAQADTETQAGTSDIDCFGIRQGGTANAFDGKVQEIQIYDCESTRITTGLNKRLEALRYNTF